MDDIEVIENNEELIEIIPRKKKKTRKQQKPKKICKEITDETECLKRTDCLFNKSRK